MSCYVPSCYVPSCNTTSCYPFRSSGSLGYSGLGALAVGGGSSTTIAEACYAKLPDSEVCVQPQPMNVIMPGPVVCYGGPTQVAGFSPCYGGSSGSSGGYFGSSGGYSSSSGRYSGSFGGSSGSIGYCRPC